MAERIVPDRFLDAGEEPTKTLTSIKGYEKAPLVSLKEAIEPVQSLLYDAESMIETAIRNSRKPADGLTPDESAAIHLYTMQWPKPHPSLYNVLNQRLRTKNRDTLISWFLFLKLFFTALYKLPSLKGTIWRGVRGNLSDQYDGDQIWWGASSCTETMKIMETFVGPKGARTLFTIECINGKAIQAHSYFEEENEILLMPGSYFQVMSKWEPAKDLYMIHLREKTPPYQTITPPFDLSSPLITTPSLAKLAISTEKKGIPGGNTALAISSDTKWKQNGITIAGGNGRGDRLNQLYYPQIIYVDDDQTIYIADCENHRIVEWKCNEKNGQIVAGGNGQGNRSDQLNGPRDVIIDKQNDSLIISDRGNRRVMRWSRQNNTSGQIIIPDNYCFGLRMDNNGSLYVSDVGKNEVRRWRIGDSCGTIVAGGNGQGDHLNQLSFPTYIFVDEDYSVYVSDLENHRVIKWMKGAKEGIVVAGGRGQGNRLTQLYCPQGVIVDQLGQIYVADCENHRVMRWCKGAKEGTIVVGGNGEGEQSNQLSYPRGLSFDRQGNLYVVDWGNHRIQKFDIE